MNKRIIVAGVGSIGSAACAALIDYGARALTLIDPDLLDSHNFARHVANADQIGRLKVDAVAEQLTKRDTRIDVRAIPIDVVQHADVVRKELETAHAVLDCTDGIEPRRVANHLAVRAGVPAVFACVLGDGAVGEIVRVQTPRFGCLLCQRRGLVHDGVMDPEPSLDRGYGDGIGPHLPMTAVGGDLALMGQLAAKVVVATLLEGEGHRDQHLDGEHGIVGLRPVPTLPAPFDVPFGSVVWHPGRKGHPGCPTCDRDP
ncbi:MAG: ThiF family adenylyltransferase [Patulibacter sp.]|nr:ThiF family adenylyltransferase [Patulibacter sp.]